MADNTLGLFFEISADPSKAEAALEGLKQAHGSTLSQISSAQTGFEQTFTQGVDRALTPAVTTVKQIDGAVRQQLIPGLSQAGNSFRDFQEIGAQAFAGVSEAMGRSLAAATVYSTSISDAMGRALKAALASIAGEAIARALFETGMGFAALASFDFESASLWFQAAAVHGAIGGAVAGLGAAVPGGATAGTSRSSGPPPGGSGPQGGPAQSHALAPGSASAVAPTVPNGRLTVLVMGEPNAAQWMARTLNTYVVQNDGRLISSHTRNAPVATK